MCRLALHSLPLAVVALLFSPTRASAGAILITHGDTINHVGEIKIPQAIEAFRKLGLNRPAVGYKYSYWGLFSLDLWTWRGEYCVFEDKKGWIITTLRRLSSP